MWQKKSYPKNMIIIEICAFSGIIPTNYYYFWNHFISFCCRLCPIFLVSSVTGENLDLLKTFLNLLSTRIAFNNEDPAEFQIDDIYTVPVCFVKAGCKEAYSGDFINTLFMWLGCWRRSLWNYVERGDKVERHSAIRTRSCWSFHDSVNS